MSLVRKVVERAAKGVPGQTDQHAPSILLSAYGDSAIEYKISIWSEDPWQSGRLKSDMLDAPGAALKDAGIVIAYPQLQLHLYREPTPEA